MRHLRRSAILWLLAGLGTACEVLNPPDERDISCRLPGVRAVPSGGSHPALASVEHVPMSGAPTAVAVAPDGEIFVTRFGAHSLMRAAAATTTFTGPLEVGDQPSQIRLSPDGATAYVNNEFTGYVAFIDVADNRVIETVHVTGYAVTSLGLSPDGARLYALTDLAGVIVLDAAAPEWWTRSRPTRPAAT